METDIELLKAARARDPDAFVKIFDLYSSALYKYAMLLGHDPIMADNVVGDVFAKLLEHLAEGRGPTTNLRSYLYQMTHNMLIDQGRSSRKNAPIEVADWLQQDKRSAASNVEEQMMLDVVLKAIQNDLTEDQQHVVVLRFIEDFSLKETAAIIGKTISNVKVLQNRALAKLRRRLEYHS
jgi:RNA polymerase sigma-70 factor (ECF subfamily)